MKQELILEIIKERWSPYSFSSYPVEEYKLKAMLEAASYAPSCNNEQPWIFVYTTQENAEVFNDYLGFLSDSNKVWARHAYALIISMARTKFSYSKKPNRYAFHDTGMAVSNLLLQAVALDIYVHQMGVGYLGEGISLPPELLRRDENRRSRKSVNEFAFKNFLTDPAFKIT